jgi:hypothetical protein
MDRKELEAIGRELFGLKTNGYGWQAEMARQLNDIPVRTVASWGKEYPVPKPVAALLIMLRDARNQLDSLSRPLAGR